MSKLNLTSKEKSIIERIIGYPIVKEKDVTVVKTYHWIHPEHGPYYRVERSMLGESLDLISEDTDWPEHSIPMEIIALVEQGYEPYIYPCAECLERSRKHREKHGYSLGYGCLIIVETEHQRIQYCTRPECTNNVIETFPFKDELQEVKE